ncbi:hypothetical protein ELI_0499 [Eubacterium callanderi]|uniref:Uncharacterized protein n=1 Tax=Eubacterium callanderi TaxID=53442 RepID=E3GIN0_9FIRM|nr:hypothetical protein ELI_0499 [Eubacterium callanderi]
MKQETVLTETAEWRISGESRFNGIIIGGALDIVSHHFEEA